MASDENKGGGICGNMDITLSCLSSLEKLTARVYRKIRGKTRDTYASLIFSFISHDSEKHSVMFKDMASIMGKPRSTRISIARCSSILGSFYREAYYTLLEVENITDNVEIIDEELMVKLVEKLTAYEDTAGEEYLVGLTAYLLSEEARSLQEAYRRILSLIGEDEKRHQELLEELASRLRTK